MCCIQLRRLRDRLRSQLRPAKEKGSPEVSWIEIWLSESVSSIRSPKSIQLLRLLRLTFAWHSKSLSANLVKSSRGFWALNFTLLKGHAFVLSLKQKDRGAPRREVDIVCTTAGSNDILCFLRRPEKSCWRVPHLSPHGHEDFETSGYVAHACLFFCFSLQTKDLHAMDSGSTPISEVTKDQRKIDCNRHQKLKSSSPVKSKTTLHGLPTSFRTGVNSSIRPMIPTQCGRRRETKDEKAWSISRTFTPFSIHSIIGPNRNAAT